MVRIGVISDTHGLLRDEAVATLRGCELIIHAGDIGRPQVLERLGEVAPVLAVRGNVDSGGWAQELPYRRTVAVDEVRLRVLHVREEFREDPVREGYSAVIYGHSHRPAVEEREGVLFLNPGSAGPRRFGQPVSVAILHVEGSGARAELIPLQL
jgi:uncharacterized protein